MCMSDKFQLASKEAKYLRIHNTKVSSSYKSKIAAIKSETNFISSLLNNHKPKLAQLYDQLKDKNKVLSSNCHLIKSLKTVSQHLLVLNINNGILKNRQINQILRDFLAKKKKLFQKNSTLKYNLVLKVLMNFNNCKIKVEL